MFQFILMFSIFLAFSLSKLTHAVQKLNSGSIDQDSLTSILLTVQSYTPDFILQIQPISIIDLNDLFGMSGFDGTSHTLNYLMTFTPVFAVLMFIVLVAGKHLIVKPIIKLIVALKNGLRSLLRSIIRITVIILLTIFLKPFVILFDKIKSSFKKKDTVKKDKVKKYYIRKGFNKFKSLSKTFFSFLLLRFFIYGSKDRYNQACAA